MKHERLPADTTRRIAGFANALLLALATMMVSMPVALAQLVADLAAPKAAPKAASDAASDVSSNVASNAAPDTAFSVESSHLAIAPADGDGFVPLRFQPSGEPALQLKAGPGGWNWSDASEVRMHLQNAMPWPVTVQVRLSDQSGGTLDATLGLPPGGPLTLSIPLQATNPRRWGMTAGPPVPWLQERAPVAVALTTIGQLDRRRVASIRIAMPRPAAEQTLRIGKVFLEPETAGRNDQERMAYTRIVDAFGQYTRGDWEEKLKASAAQASAPQASADPQNGRRDAFGGLLDSGFKPAAGAKTAGTGFFRTAKMQTASGDGRWLLLTPLGNPFFSLGVNAIQLNNSQTFVEGREFMFTDLPDAGHPLARFYGRQDSATTLALEAGAQRGRGYGKGRTFDFYRANLFRRDGAGFEKQWLDRTRNRLKQWDFNTVGSWSDPEISHGAKIAYTRAIHVEGDFSKLSDGHNWWAGIADPFDPRFAQSLERAVQLQAKPLKDDPYLLGYFVDNELGWGNGAATDPAVRYALAYSALSGDAAAGGAHAKRAMIELLRSRYAGSIEKLAASWQKPLRSWEALLPPLPADDLPDGRIASVAADLSAFLALHAERYFQQVAQTLKRHDPNHLYLGSRFASRNPEALQACAHWCDVVSFNLYLPTIDVGFEPAAFHQLDKPAMLTEFHFASSDRGPFWHGVMPVPSEADRGPAYARMLKSVLANPDFVGAHWFQYLDQPVTGRWLDGENGHVGLVAITDIPWGGFVSHVSASNRFLQETLREQLKAP